MRRDDDDTRKPPSEEPDSPDTRAPWWSEDAPEEADLPAGFPERPDIRKVHELRGRMTRERATREAAGRSRLVSKFDEKVGKQARDLGSYTLIPMLMLAGPAVGYALGLLVEKLVGGAPWVSIGGVLFGLAAGFHQVILLVKKNSAKK